MALEGTGCFFHSYVVAQEALFAVFFKTQERARTGTVFVLDCHYFDELESELDSVADLGVCFEFHGFISYKK